MIFFVDMPILVIAYMPIFSYERSSYIQISALKMFDDSRYADIDKKSRYADIANADINISTPLQKSVAKMAPHWNGFEKQCHFTVWRQR